jgi:radical SAM protein with 4Fe4S-binding SPASM domain
VNVTGDLYPCHILADRDEFVMGNIEDPQWFSSPAAERVFRVLENSRKQQNPYCSKCWARYICWGCLGRWKAEGSESVFITDSRCKMKKQIWEMIIRKIMAVKDDEPRWARFEENVKKLVQSRRPVSATTDVNNWVDFGQGQSAPAQTSSAGD